MSDVSLEHAYLEKLILSLGAMILSGVFMAAALVIVAVMGEFTLMATAVFLVGIVYLLMGAALGFRTRLNPVLARFGFTVERTLDDIHGELVSDE